MPKSVSSIITTLFKSRSGKLVSDAEPLDDPKENEGESSVSSETNVSTIVSTEFTSDDNISKPKPTDSESTSEGTEIVPVSAAGVLVSTVPTNAVEPSNVNNTLAVQSTVQGYNVYQFSQINGLHIGSVFNIQQPNPETPEKRPKSGEPIRKTTTIDGRHLFSLFFFFLILTIF